LHGGAEIGIAQGRPKGRAQRRSLGRRQGAPGKTVEVSPAGSYDYVIAGAGSAGCLLANRLSADPATTVLLLEAGGQDDWFWIDVPVGYLYTIANPRTDWC